jgi:hypothetical protein
MCPSGKYSSAAGMPRCRRCGKHLSTQLLAACAIRARSTAPPVIVGSGGIVCPNGAYQSKGDRCRACLPGKFRSNHDGGNASICNRCRAGEYQLLAGQRSCNKCPVAPVIQECTPPPTPAKSCPKGKYEFSFQNGATHTSGCAPCPLGKFRSGAVLDPRCSLCSVGTYQTEIAQSSCSSCPGGRYSPGTRDVCFECPSRPTTELTAGENPDTAACH